MRHDPLTLHDVAVLCDGLGRAPSPGLAGRLRLLAQQDERAAELEALARDAGLAEERRARLESAWEVQEDLVHLLEADAWDDPYAVLASGAGHRMDLRGLLRLAESRASRPEPPAGLAAVREKLARAVARLDRAEARLDALVDGLLDHDPRQAEDLLRRAAREVRRRGAAGSSRGPAIVR